MYQLVKRKDLVIASPKPSWHSNRGALLADGENSPLHLDKWKKKLCQPFRFISNRKSHIHHAWFISIKSLRVKPDETTLFPTTSARQKLDPVSGELEEIGRRYWLSARVHLFPLHYKIKMAVHARVMSYWSRIYKTGHLSDYEQGVWVCVAREPAGRRGH